MTSGQVLSLLLAAQVDPDLSVIDRARAAHHIGTLYDPPERLEPGLISGGRLTDAGRETLHMHLPSPTPSVFPYAVADVLRRMRVLGYPCTGVRCEPVDGGWRVTWDGDGWEVLSRISMLPHAEQNRADLIDAALSCELAPMPEAAASLLVKTPQVEYIEVPSEHDVDEHQKLWDRYCRASDKARERYEDYDEFRQIDDALFADYLNADAALIRSRFQPIADAESQSGT